MAQAPTDHRICPPETGLADAPADGAVVLVETAEQLDELEADTDVEDE